MSLSDDIRREELAEDARRGIQVSRGRETWCIPCKGRGWNVDATTDATVTCAECKGTGKEKPRRYVAGQGWVVS